MLNIFMNEADLPKKKTCIHINTSVWTVEGNRSIWQHGTNLQTTHIYVYELGFKPRTILL